eukprot:COSAG02_NODE_39996_length_410_cov_0.832797_1_plen_61_part_10
MSDESAAGDISIGFKHNLKRTHVGNLTCRERPPAELCHLRSKVIRYVENLDLVSAFFGVNH